MDIVNGGDTFKMLNLKEGNNIQYDKVHSFAGISNTDGTSIHKCAPSNDEETFKDEEFTLNDRKTSLQGEEELEANEGITAKEDVEAEAIDIDTDVENCPNRFNQQTSTYQQGEGIKDDSIPCSSNTTVSLNSVNDKKDEMKRFDRDELSLYNIETTCHHPKVYEQNYDKENFKNEPEKGNNFPQNGNFTNDYYCSSSFDDENRMPVSSVDKSHRVCSDGGYNPLSCRDITLGGDGDSGEAYTGEAHSGEVDKGNADSGDSGNGGKRESGDGHGDQIGNVDQSGSGDQGGGDHGNGEDQNGKDDESGNKNPKENYKMYFHKIKELKSNRFISEYKNSEKYIKKKIFNYLRKNNLINHMDIEQLFVYVKNIYFLIIRNEKLMFFFIYNTKDVMNAIIHFEKVNNISYKNTDFLLFLLSNDVDIYEKLLSQINLKFEKEELISKLKNLRRKVKILKYEEERNLFDECMQQLHLMKTDSRFKRVAYKTGSYCGSNASGPENSNTCNADSTSLARSIDLARSSAQANTGDYTNSSPYTNDHDNDDTNNECNKLLEISLKNLIPKLYNCKDFKGTGNMIHNIGKNIKKSNTVIDISEKKKKKKKKDPTYSNISYTKMDYSKMPPMMNVPHGSGIYSNMAHTRGGMYTSVPPQSGAYPNMPPANSPYTNVPPANGPYANSITPAGLHSNVPHPKGGFSNVTHPSGGYTHIPNQSSAHANPQTASGTYVNVNSHPNGANGFHANNFQGAQGENYAPSYAANYAAGYTPNQGANCAPNLGPNYEGIYPQAGNNNYGKGCSNGHPSDHSNSHSNDNSNEYGSECANDYMNDYMHDYMNEYLNDYGMDDPTSGNHLDDTKEEKKKTIRGITSFTLFAREKRKELLNQKVFLGSSLTEQTTAVAKIWNSLSDEKKKEWAAKASKINEENYLSQKKKKKRKFTAFSIFAREKRKEHKEKNIDMGLTLAQQNSYVSKLWKQLSNEEKNKYKVLSNNVNAEVAKTNKNDMNYMSGEKLSGFKGRIKALDNMMNQQFSGNALPYHSGVNNMGYVNGMGYMHGVGTGRAPIGVVPPGQMNAASPQNGLSSTPNQGNPPSGINLPSGSIAPNESNDVNNLGYMDYVNYMNTVLSHDNPNYMNKIMSGGNENYMSMMNRLTNEMANGMTQEFTGTSPNGPPTGDPVKEKKNAKMKKKNKKEHMYITEQGQLMQKNDSYKMGKDGLPHETNNNMIGAFPSEAHTGVNPYNGNMPNVTNMAHVTNSGSYSQNNVPVNGPTPNNGNASVDMVHANNLLNYYSNQENPNVNQNSVNNVGSLTSPPNGKVHPPISMNGSGNPATAAMTNPPTGVDKKQPMINEQPNSNMGVMTDPSMFNNPNNNTANMISNVPYGGMPMGNPLPGNNNALNGVPFNNVPFNAVPPMYNIPPSGAPQGGTASGLPGGNFNPAGGMDMGRGPNGMNKQPFSNPYMSNVAGVHMHNVGENHLSLIPDHLIAGRKTKSKDKMEEMMRKKMKKDEKQKLKEKKLMMKMYDKKRKQLLKAEKQMEKNKKNKNKNGVNAFEDGSGGMYYNHPYPPNLIGTNINGIPFGAPNALMNKPMGGNFNPYVSMNQVDTKNMNIKNVTMASMMREGNPANHGVDNRAIPPNFQPANHMNNALSSTMRNNQPTPYPFSNNYPSDIPNMGNYTPGNQMKGYDDASRGVQDKQVAAIPTQPPNEVTTYQNVTLNEESKEKNVNPMDANLVVDSAGGNVTDAKSIPLMNEKEYRENYYKDVGGTDFAAYQQADSNKGAEVDKVADHMDKQANQEKSFCEPNGMNPMVGNVPTGHDSANASFDKQFLANENNPVEHKAETYYNQNENSKSKENATLYGEESLSVNYNHFNSSTPVTAQQQATFNKTLNEDVNVDLNYGNGSFVQTDACNGDNQNNTTGYFYPQGSAISGDKEESEKVNNPGAYGNQEMDGVVDANNVMYCPEQMLPENGVNKNLVYFDTDPNELPEMTDDTEMEAPKEKQFFSSASHYSELINKKVKKKKTLCSPNDANDNGGTIWDLVQKKGRKKIKVNSANQVEGESENVPMEDGTMYTNKNDFSFMETNNEWNSGRVGVNVECTSKEEEADDIVNSIFRSLEMEENVSPPEGGAAVSQNGDNVVAGEDTLLNPANQNHAEDATNWENETSLEQNNEDDIINLIDGPAQSYSNKLNITESGEVIYEEKKKYNSNIIMSENCIQNNRMNMLMSKRGKINTNLNRSQIETYNNAYKKSALFKWTDEETDKFYQAIEMFGVDLMMVRAFLPKFSDKQIRDKYKKERRNNPLKIEEAIKKNKEIDLDAYENENGRIETSGDLNSDASSISADDDNDVKRKGSVTSETDGNVLTLFEGKEDVDYDMNQHHDNQEDPDFNVLSLF